jgi:V8-like Glu-specific endopeptidase
MRSFDPNGSSRTDCLRSSRGALKIGLSAALLALSIARGAGADLRPGIIGEDHRVPVTDTDPSWNAIGQVNVGGYRTLWRCTGSLIAPNLVLTAAHCLIDPWKEMPYPLHLIHFVAGVRGASNKGTSIAKCLHFADHGLARPATPEDFRNDIAVVVLKDALPIEPLPLAESAEAETLPLVHAAYAADRRYALSAHFNCRVLGAGEDHNVWRTDCDTHPASSGGPLLVEIAGVRKLAAIMVAAGGHKFNVAVPVSRWRQLTENAGCP